MIHLFFCFSGKLKYSNIFIHFFERITQMKKLLSILVMMVAISTCPTHLSAQWVQTSGPEGGQVTCFTTIGANLFAGTGGGVFLSSNNGTNWSPVNDGLWNTGISSLAVIGTNLFAGTPWCRSVSFNEQRCYMDQCEQRNNDWDNQFPCCN